MAPNMAALTAQFENTDMRLIESQYDLAAPYIIKIMDRICTGLDISTYDFVSNRTDPLRIIHEILEHGELNSYEKHQYLEPVRMCLAEMQQDRGHGGMAKKLKYIGHRLELLFEGMKMRENLLLRRAQENVAKARRNQDPAYNQRQTEQATEKRPFKYHNAQDPNGAQQPPDLCTEKLIDETKPPTEQPAKKLPIRERPNAAQIEAVHNTANTSDDVDDDYVLVEDPWELVDEL